MIKKLLFPIFIAGYLCMTSCSSYLIPLDSFKKQFSKIDSASMNFVRVRGPYGETLNYLANPIRQIRCVDKNGNALELRNGPSIEIRFTYGTKNNKAIYYFDRIYVNDSIVVGVQSRIISSIRKTIPLKSITKIEVQDGKKKYYYL